ncbi:MAG: MATE family efflux transporter [Kiritimatiellae bacterium]|nr:MATE family efflux transporter [Kiritimatiellia bacterium]
MSIRPKSRLTEGPLSRALLWLAGPMLIGAVLQDLQTLIDLYWVGRLGSEAVAAISLSGVTLMTLMPVVMGLTAGTVAMVSRRTGAGLADEAAGVAGESLVLAGILGATLGGVGWTLAGRICSLLGAAPDVAPLAGAYLRIIFLGSFTVFLLFVGNSILQAAGNTVVPMLAMMFANMLNLVLDPILIFGLLGCPRMEVRGAALATVISQFAAAVLVISLLAIGPLHVRVAIRWARPLSRRVLQIARIGLPGSGQMLARSLMALVLMSTVASCGTAAVAAYGIGLRLHGIILMPAFALGGAAATLVGQNLGARQPGRAARAAWLAVGIDEVIMICAALLLAALAPRLVGFFDKNPSVIATGSSYLRTTSGFYVFAALGIVLGRALQGAGDPVAPMVSTIFSLWGLQVPLAKYWSTRFTPATQGIWWAIVVATITHGTLMAGWFLLGRWKHRQV